MSVYITPRMFSPADIAREGDSPASRFRRKFQTAVRNWKRRKMIAALQALNDRTLRDIGIDRSEIARVVDGFDDRELAMEPMASQGATAKAEFEPYLKAA